MYCYKYWASVTPTLGYLIMGIAGVGGWGWKGWLVGVGQRCGHFAKNLETGGGINGVGGGARRLIDEGWG